MLNDPLITIVTPTIGRPLLTRCIESVANQSYQHIQHLIFVDGPDKHDDAYEAIGAAWTDQMVKVVPLPYSVGRDNWNGHRIMGAGCHLADGDYMMFLDDDNYLDPTHVQDCLDVMSNNNNQWTFSLRKIVDQTGGFLCNDDCESLGKWPSVLGQNDYFIDVNCYFLPRVLAMQISPVMFRKFRVPGQMEIDRAMCYVLRQIAPNYDCTYKYTTNYTVASNNQLSVKPEFFIRGNSLMLQQYNGYLPWKK